MRKWEKLHDEIHEMVERPNNCPYYNKNHDREELDFIWKNIDHLDDPTFGDAGNRLTIMRLYSMGIPYRALMSAYEGLNPNECYQKIYEWACKQ